MEQASYLAITMVSTDDTAGEGIDMKYVVQRLAE